MKKIILIIDDDEAFQKVISAKLESNNYKVLNARDGDEGFKSAVQGKPDLILLDIRMPKLDGMEFLRKLRLVKDIPEIPVLITSNLDTMDYVSEGVTLGVKGYIVKSNDKLDAIVDEVNIILSSSTR